MGGSRLARRRVAQVLRAPTHAVGSDSGQAWCKYKKSSESPTRDVSAVCHAGVCALREVQVVKSWPEVAHGRASTVWGCKNKHRSVRTLTLFLLTKIFTCQLQKYQIKNDVLWQTQLLLACFPGNYFITKSLPWFIP